MVGAAVVGAGGRVVDGVAAAEEVVAGGGGCAASDVAATSGGSAEGRPLPHPPVATVTAASAAAKDPTYHGRATMTKRMVHRSLVVGVVLALATLIVGCGGAAGRPSAVAHATRTVTHASSPATSPPAVPLSTTSLPPMTSSPTTLPSTTTTTLPVTTTTTAPARPTCSASLAGSLASTGAASQLITVNAPSYTTTTATVTLWQRQGACWVLAGGPWPGAIGLNGFSDHHHEGDPTTPTGAYPVGRVMYGTAPDPGVRYQYHQLVCGDWWDEDPSSPFYNTFQHVPCGQTPAFGDNSEALWQEGNAYPSFVVVDYNTDPAVPGAGSGVFIHADIGGPTNGCVSLPLGELDTLLRWLDPADSPLVVMGPDSEISHF